MSSVRILVDTDAVPDETATGKGEVSLQFGAKSKSDLVRDLDLFSELFRGLQFLSSFAYVGRNDQLSSKEPVFQLKMRAMTNSPRNQSELMTAFPALIWFSRLDSPDIV